MPRRWWPHHEQIAWQRKNQGEKEILRQFAWHRVADLLATLSAASHEYLLAANVISVCSGHWANVETVKMVAKDLVPFA